MDQPIQWTGTLVNINSHTNGLLGIYVNDISSTCTIDIEPGTETILSMLYFVKSSSDEDCTKSVIVYDDEAIYKFCTVTTATNYMRYTVPCRSTKRTLYVKYLNEGPNTLKVIFVLQATSKYCQLISGIKI